MFPSPHDCFVGWVHDLHGTLPLDEYVVPVQGVKSKTPFTMSDFPPGLAQDMANSIIFDVMVGFVAAVYFVPELQKLL